MRCAWILILGEGREEGEGEVSFELVERDEALDYHYFAFAPPLGVSHAQKMQDAKGRDQNGQPKSPTSSDDRDILSQLSGVVFRVRLLTRSFQTPKFIAHTTYPNSIPPKDKSLWGERHLKQIK